jgi:hypothetical protein
MSEAWQPDAPHAPTPSPKSGIRSSAKLTSQFGSGTQDGPPVLLEVALTEELPTTRSGSPYRIASSVAQPDAQPATQQAAPITRAALHAHDFASGLVAR